MLWCLLLRHTILSEAKMLHFVSTGLLLPSNCSPFRSQKGYSCIAKGLHLEVKEAPNWEQGGVGHSKNH